MGHRPGRRALDSPGAWSGSARECCQTHRCDQRRRTSRRATASRGPRCSWPSGGSAPSPRTGRCRRSR
eukprot:3477024-Prymnesium_polylepis.1